MFCSVYKQNLLSQPEFMSVSPMSNDRPTFGKRSFDEGETNKSPGWNDKYFPSKKIKKPIVDRNSTSQIKKGNGNRQKRWVVSKTKAATSQTEAAVAQINATVAETKAAVAQIPTTASEIKAIACESKSGA